MLIDRADISEADGRTRLGQARAWLAWMRSAGLNVGAWTTPWLVCTGLRRVLLGEGTHLKCVGQDGTTWRIPTACEVLSGRLTEAQRTNRHVGERWKLVAVHAGDLVVSDAIQGSPERIGWGNDQQADALGWCSAPPSPRWNAEGRRVDLIGWLKGRHAPAGRIGEAQVWFHLAEERQRPVRLVTFRLSETHRQAAHNRTDTKASHRGTRSTPTADPVSLAGWLIVVTPLPAEQWSAQDGRCVSRARRHSALFFPRFQQFLDGPQVTCVPQERVHASILAHLVAWALQDEEREAARLWFHEATALPTDLPSSAPLRPEPEHGQHGVRSQWMLATVRVDLLRRPVAGHLSAARFRQCFPRFPRFVRTNPRRRTPWSSQTWTWPTSPDASVSLPAEVRSIGSGCGFCSRLLGRPLYLPAPLADQDTRWRGATGGTAPRAGLGGRGDCSGGQRRSRTMTHDPRSLPAPGPHRETGAHLLALPDPTWTLWRQAALRSAGFPAHDALSLAVPACAQQADRYLQSPPDEQKRLSAAWQQTFADGQRETSHAIQQIVRQPRFQEALLWQNRQAFATGVAGLVHSSPEDTHHLSQKRQHEILVARYVQRYCLKNDTIGFFGPVGWLWLDSAATPFEDCPGLGLLAERWVYFEQWCISALADTIAQEAAYRPWLIPRRMPHLHLEGTTLCFPFGRQQQLTALQARVWQA